MTNPRPARSTPARRVSGFFATLEGDAATPGAGAEWMIQAGSGVFSVKGRAPRLSLPGGARVGGRCDSGRGGSRPARTARSSPSRSVCSSPESSTLDQLLAGDEVLEIIGLFANQAAAALHCGKLRELAEGAGALRAW